MSLIINLAPDVEEWLCEEATQRGMSANEYGRQLIELSLSRSGARPFYETASLDEWKQALEEWLRSVVSPSSAPPGHAGPPATVPEERG